MLTAGAVKQHIKIIIYAWWNTCTSF